jgi:acyl-CoA synthetase (AMP-forming)/AMP-acid ligase II
MLVAITPIEQADDLLWYRIDPSREVQVVDESGEVLPPGQEGLVRMRIDDGLDGDLDDPIATHEFFRDGYFYPGDFGEFGQDCGWRSAGACPMWSMCLASRSRPARSSKRCRTACRPKGFASCRFPAAKRTRRRTRSILAIEAGPDARASGNRECRECRAQRIKQVPVHIDFVAAMPRNDMGKIDRRALREEIIRTRIRTGGSRAP